MEDIIVGRVMSSEVFTVTPETEIEEAADMLMERGIGSLVVVDENNQPSGILTSTDFVRLVAEGDPQNVTTVADHMSQEVATIGVHDDIQTAADRLITFDIHHLPVVDDTEGVVGMLSTADLTSYISDLQTPTL